MGIKGVIPARFCAAARSRCIMCPAGPPRHRGGFSRRCGPGEVVVIDKGGRTYATVWGDLIEATLATRKKNRGNRHRRRLQGRAHHPQAGIQHLYQRHLYGHGKRPGGMRPDQCAVSVSGVRVNPGDLVAGDDTGVVVIPQKKRKRY